MRWTAQAGAQGVFEVATIKISDPGAHCRGDSEPMTVGRGMVYPEKIVLPGHNATTGDLASLLQRAVLAGPVVDGPG